MIPEIEEKTQRLQEMLTSNGLGGVLLNAQHNFAWLTGGGSNGVDASRDSGASFLFVRADGKRFVIANSIEMPRLLAEEISVQDFEPIELSWQQEKASSDAVFSFTRPLLQNGREIATDIYLSPKLHPIEGLIAVCRYQLNTAEIDRYRDLGRDTSEALSSLAGKLAPGVTEVEVASKARDELSAYQIFSVVTLVGADDRIEKYRHPVPTFNDWKKTLLIAVCARRRGLIVSLTRIMCAGDIPDELARRTEAAAVVSARLQRATTPGTKASDLYRVAEATYAELGFADEINKHHQGGASGYRTRDWLAHPANNETVKLNQAFAWNPSITGTKTEVTGIATASGFEVITTAAGFPQIGTEIDGRKYLSPGILSLSKGVSA